MGLVAYQIFEGTSGVKLPFVQATPDRDSESGDSQIWRMI